MQTTFAQSGASHPLDIDLDSLSLTVEQMEDTQVHNVDDCLACVGSLSTAGCWGSVSSFTSVISCGS